MKEILEFIGKKRVSFAQLPFFEFLRDSTISPNKRLSFAPCAAPFIMGFAALNRDVFREEPATDELQKIINQHTDEDDHHWQWFLEDLATLGLDPTLKFTDLLRFVWGDYTVASHRLLQDLYRYTFQASSVQKLVVMEVLELTGNVLLVETSNVVQEIQSDQQQDYHYFGSHHLMVDAGHSCFASEFRDVIENTEVNHQLQQELFAIVDYLFSRFEELTNGFLKYVKELDMQVSMGINPVCNENVSEFDYVVIGAGPAGLQMGYFLEKAGRNYIILESGETPGTFFKDFPRHKKLISINKRYSGYEDPEINLRWDWNSLLSDDGEMRFTRYSKDYFPATEDLVRYLGDFAEHYRLNVRCNCLVSQISKDDGFTLVDTAGNTFKAKRLIIATGLSKAYVPNIPGIELAENYTDISIDPDDFINQRVLIIGKGNSGFETADSLVSTASLINIVSPNPVSLAWKTKYVGHLRAINNNLIDTYQLKSQNVILDAFVEQIEWEDNQFVVTFNYTHANGELEKLTYDRVIVCTGFRFDPTIFDVSCQPELTIYDRFPKQTSAWESSNVKDLYFAGTLTHMRDFKKKQSGFIHGFRYNIQALHQILESRYYHQAFPCRTIDGTAEALTTAILDRVNITSALWQQTGFLCDLIVVSEGGDTARYYQDLPVDYIQDGALGQNEHYYTVTLEFGLDIILASPDPLAVERVHKDDVDNAALSSGIHPIVRRFSYGELVAEHHVIEDIASEWKERVHVEPLEKFLNGQLSTLSKKSLGLYLLEAGLIDSEQFNIALAEQRASNVCLEEVFVRHGWVSQQTVDYWMDKVVYKKLGDGGQRLGAYLVDAGLVSVSQVEMALMEQKMTDLRLGCILSQHGWVSQRTVEYLMEQVVLPERQAALMV